MEHRDASARYLALDTGSPNASVALINAAGTCTELRLEVMSTVTTLLPAIAELLAGYPTGQLAGIVATAGPGSFTGLRVGLATVLGLHQAWAVPATAIPTLPLLAATVPAALLRAHGGEVVAVVDALRGSWFAQRFTPDPEAGGLPQPPAPPWRLTTPELSQLGRAVLVGFGVEQLVTADLGELFAFAPPPLAAVAAELAHRGSLAFDPTTLASPLYLSAPVVAGVR